jgi:hypothetical protein
VLAALARILQLSDAERAYLHALADYPDPVPDADARDRDNLAIMHFLGKPTRVLRTAGQAAPTLTT